MSEWISVDERLPNHTADVLVTDGVDCSIAYLASSKDYWIGMCDGDVVMDYDHNAMVVKPTHWMPLPEPPK